LMRLVWPNEAVAANVSNGADKSISAWAVMTDANKSSDGKFEFRGSTTSHLQYHFHCLRSLDLPHKIFCNCCKNERIFWKNII
jgi:hypothetical protein